MKTFFLILLIGISADLCLAQNPCSQKHPNSLFSEKQFLDFTGSVSKGEKLLLSWDFCLQNISKSTDGTATYYDYRIGHTYKVKNSRFTYEFDIISITDHDSGFYYTTSSNQNFIAYRNKLEPYKDRGIKDDPNSMIVKYDGKEYLLVIDRTVNQGFPKYRIRIIEW